MSTTAGEQMRPAYTEVGRMFPILPGECWIDDDMVGGPEAVTNGLTTPPMVPLGVPRFAVQADLVLPVKTARHECGHAFEFVMMDRLGSFRGWSPEQAKDFIRTRYWEARFGPAPYAAAVPATWQDAQALSDAEAPGSNAQWMYLPGESFAENFRNVVVGYFDGEKTMDYGVTLTSDRIERVRACLDDLMMEAGVQTMKTYEFSAPLDASGSFTWLGATAIKLTEAQRQTLGLVSGRAYTADMQRIWLGGDETSFPDTLANVYEDTTVALGQTGRWKIGAAARRDFGGTGRYLVRIVPRTSGVTV